MSSGALAYIKQNWAKAYFLLAVVLIVFICGFAVGQFKVFPHAIMKGAWTTFKVYHGRLKNEFPGLNAARYEGKGVVVKNEERMFPGVTLIGVPWKQGEDWLPSLQLVDEDGALLHKWTIDPQSVWQESPHTDLMRGTKQTKLDTYIHGAILLPDGDVVMNLSHYAMVRVNACSEIVWRLPYRAHHSLHMDERGDFWASGEKWIEEPAEQFPGLSTPFVEDTIIQVSPDGKILREISVLESIYRSGYEGLLFAGGMGKVSGDVTHNNDSEVLSEALAPKFDGLAAGDIMVSLRNINTVLIIDGKTELVKWALTHPFVHQHDPDFLDSGYISVFDNRSDPKRGNAPSFGGSRIVRVKPFSNEAITAYETRPDNNFYTRAGGKHQNLPNGNMLMTEPYAGRVFEVTADGELVWSWLADKWADGDVRVPEVLGGTRYPHEYAQFSKECA